MRQCKKRIIVISLASIMTVLGSFGVENYKNTIMSMAFNNSDNKVGLTIYTKNNYQYPLKYMKNGNSYEITLEESNYNLSLSEKVWPPEISKIRFSTVPYTNENPGHTKIIVTLANDMPFSVKTALFLPDNIAQQAALQDKHSNTTQKTASKPKSYWDDDDDTQAKNTAAVHKKTESVPVKKQQTQTKTPIQPQNQVQTQPQTKQNTTNAYNKNTPQQSYVPDYSADTYDSDPRTRMYAVIGIMMVVLMILLFVFWSRDRMAALLGDQSNYDFGDKEKKKRNNSSIKKYSELKSKNFAKDDVYTKSEEYSDNIDSPTSEPKEEVNVIDLDALYNKTTQQNQTTPEESAENNEKVDEEETNSDLDDFLSEFSFDEYAADIPQETPAPQPEEEAFDEQLYEECINNNNLTFTSSDIEKIDSLLQKEITSEIMDRRADYLRMLEEKKNIPTKEQLLEEFISTYFVKQKISFTNEDVNALEKLMSVELDESFVKDLHTNPIRTKEMYTELSKKEGKPHKVSEPLTLNVKDLLPNLSEELKKYGNKRIQSDAKPQVVYFSEGYEYTKLKVDNSALDITKAKKEKEINTFRPSDMPNVVESGYDVQTISVKNILPDLNDVKANPSKYEEPKKPKPVADENALLNSIANVTFKPFYEEAKTVETDTNDTENIVETIAPPQKPVQVQINKEPIKPTISENKNTTKVPADNKAVNVRPKHTEQKAEKVPPSASASVSATSTQQQSTIKTTEEKIKRIPEYPQNCNYEGKTYKVIKVANCSTNAGCYLTKGDDGYTIFGFIKDKLYKLNDYAELKSENIQLRPNEKLQNETVQYIVKVSTHKFLMQLFSDKMELVMNLC